MTQREIKYRQFLNNTFHYWGYVNNDYEMFVGPIGDYKGHEIPSEQFTGLHDKNGLQEVYEGDIIDSNGNIKGNVHEMDARETDLVIEGFGSATWSQTEKRGLERGLKYSE